MSFRNWLQLQEMAQVRPVSWQEKEERKLFGPVYHGTAEENRKKIGEEGFKVFIGSSGTGDVRNGYNLKDYFDNIPPPVHHLGYGIYFTTSKSIAKRFNLGSGKDLQPYYIDAPRMEVINFGAARTMMRWWQANGYDMQPITSNSQDRTAEWIQSTINLTNTLKSKYDAVWFKGKGMGTLLDGDQVVVFDPDRIHTLDASLDRQENQLIPGDRILVKGTTKATKIRSIRPTNPLTEDYISSILGEKSEFLLSVDKFNTEELFNAYAKQIMDIVKEKHPDWLQNRMANFSLNSIDDAALHYVQYYFNNSIFLNFPSVLVDRVLQKGERLTKRRGS